MSYAYHFPVAPECSGCSRVKSISEPEKEICSAYIKPASWFRHSAQGCPLADNIVLEKAKAKFINPLKLSKMKKKGLA
jgi:hypothetical protein